MDVALIELANENLGEEFRREVAKQADMNFVHKKTKDLLNVLAIAKAQVDKVEYLVIIAELNEKKEVNEAFYSGLAALQATTGKQIFKLLFEPDEAVDIIEFANEFLDQVYGRKRTKEKEEDFL